MNEPSTITIRTSVGEIVGRARDERYEFTGIPYAEAPVGDLRLAAPMRRAPFAEPFSALDWGATAQKVPLFEDTLIPEPSVAGDDILNLNVFTPSSAVPNGRLPVLFWVHGGGYRAGSAIGEWFHGKSLNRHGVVVVSVSYRLGVDGFGWIDGTPNNRGLRDIVMALEWVQDHVASFGGDPTRVTIAGQSAGGGAVLALAASPLAAPLFSQVWAMSGVLHGFSITTARAAGKDFASALGVESTVAALSAFTETELQQKLIDQNPIDDGSLSRGPADGSMSVAPVVGDDVLPEPIAQGMVKHSSLKRIVVGATADEFAAPWEQAMPRAQFRGLVESWGVDSRFADSYIGRLGDGELTEGRISTDVLFRGAVAAVMRVRSAAAGPTWAYDFRWIPPELGASGHCADVPFFFNVTDTSHSLRKLGKSPAHLVTTMHREFVEFIREGDPGWAPISSAAGPVRIYDCPTTVENNAFVAVEGFADVWGEGVAT